MGTGTALVAGCKLFGMLVAFRGFVVPDPLQLAVLLSGTAIVATLLYGIRPRVSQRTVLAMIPWIVAGATLHVFYQIGEQFLVRTYPPWAEPFFAAPAVYLTTFLGMGTIWLVASLVATQSAAAASHDEVARYLAATGAGVAVTLVGLLGWQALDPAIGPLRLVIPVLGLVASLALAFVVYILLGAWRTYVIAEARHVGLLVIFAHVFDGLTTAIGVDLLGTGERSYLPRQIIEFAADLPTEAYLGTGWLFLLVKILLAVLVVVLFADYVSERPNRGNLLFAAIAVVGLGPALNNFFLFVLGL